VYATLKLIVACPNQSAAADLLRNSAMRFRVESMQSRVCAKSAKMLSLEKIRLPRRGVGSATSRGMG